MDQKKDLTQSFPLFENNSQNSQNSLFNSILSMKDENKNQTQTDIISKKFTIELLFLTKIIDPQSEADECKCHNYINLHEKIPKEEFTLENLMEKNIFIEKEIIPSLIIQTKIITEDNQQNDKNSHFNIQASNLIKQLIKYGYPLQGAHINLYVPNIENYIYIGSEPLDENLKIDSDLLGEKQNIIKLRIINHFKKNIFDQKNNNEKEEKDKELIVDKKNKIEYSSGEMNILHKRERTIGAIVEIVFEWRKMYQGFKNDKGKFVKYSAKKAAEILGLSKKSLDDYLLQIKIARSYGFDFNENKDKNIRVLREFIKSKNPKKNKRNKKNKNDNNEEKENNINEENDKNENNEEEDNQENDLDVHINKKSDDSFNSKDKNFLGKKKK